MIMVMNQMKTAFLKILSLILTLARTITLLTLRRKRKVFSTQHSHGTRCQKGS
jgi:hypothetical protein